MNLRMMMLAALLAAAMPSASHAACRWTWDCSSGQCQHVQLCDRAIDMETIEPIGIPPIATPTIQPIPRATLPPLGTSECQPAYLCSNSGQCAWRTVCR